MEIYEMTALQVAEKIKNKEITSMDAVESVAKAIEQKDGTYNCYVSLDKESALQQAERVQKKIDSARPHHCLHGVPIAIKDNICEKGKLTSCASKILSNFKPPYNATVINKLNDADMVTFGKVNMDEFAMGSTTETSFYGPTKNPVGILQEFRVVHRAVRQLLLPLKKVLLLSVRIQAVQFVSRHHSAV